MITRSCTPPTPADRLSEWAAKFYRLPVELRTRWHPIHGRQEREPADPDDYMENAA